MKEKDKNLNEIENLIVEMTKASQQLTKNYIENLPNFIHTSKDLTNVWMSFTKHILTNPDEMLKIQSSYLDLMQKQLELWQRTIKRFIHNSPGVNKTGIKENGYEPVITPDKKDKRFRGEEWNEYPYYFDLLKQNYLLISEFMMGIIANVKIDDFTRKKLKFYTELFLDSISPSNFIATNPEVLKLIQETKGQCLIDGFKNLLSDLKNGRISQTDNSAFEVGKNLAITKGAVIYENELIQLIQYAPATKKVKEIPLLIIPPWINRYYILDLEPENSFVKFAVEEGNSVFMISWRVPKEENGMGNITFDDYAEKGALKAIEVIQEITGAKKVNTFGYCIGGTLLGVVLAILRAKRKNIIASGTLLATMLDFSDIGALGALVDEALVEKLEQDLKDGKVLKGRDMTNAFNIIRANDLIWYYVVNNYLKGKKPTPFSILYWTNHNTNLPGNMYSFYLRHIIIENKLTKKNALKVCNTPIDLSKIDIPLYIIGTREDHISPCRTTFNTTRLVKGEVEFVLGEAGHVVGAINPPSKNKYGYFINGKLGEGFDNWQKTAKYQKGSWWTHWSRWLKSKSGKLIDAPNKLGSKKYPVIEPAPGRYVKEPID